MQYILGDSNLKLTNTAVTLGKFDGIHRGHQLLLNDIVGRKAEGLASVMFTFLLHPENLFSDKELNLIYTEEEKKYQLEQTGLDYLIAFPFTRETAGLEAEQFVREILVGQLDAKMIAVGSDFRFGRKRQGNVELLQRLALKYNYQLVVYKKAEMDQIIVSSTEIRRLLEKGSMEKANRLLGRPFSVLGEIVHGRRLGRTIQMPTINIMPPLDKLLPPNGVYASRTIMDGNAYYGVTNIGFKPTVEIMPIRGVETFLFDYNGDAYGKQAEVQLFDFERPEQKFDSLDKLKEQQKRDIHYAREYFCLKK